MRWWLLGLVLILTACARERLEPRSGGPRSGIEGRVTLVGACPGPMTCPPRAIAATVTIEPSSGDRIHTVETDDRGRFRIPLPPGDYLVSARVPAQPDLVPRATAVTVEPDRFALVRVVIGTRLREP
jgi:Carboxypeptidase regulatory-like domain